MTGLGYEQEVVRFTGDSVANRLVATTFALDSGIVAIWICGLASGSNNLDAFRHNGATMTGTALMGSSTLQTTSGIMSFEAGGFRVTGGTVAGFPYANVSGVLYTAIVMRDTSTDNRYLRVGTYTGLGSFGMAMTVTGPPGGFGSVVTGSGFIPDMDGMAGTDASGTYVFGYASATTGSLSPGYLGGPFIGAAPGACATTLTFAGGQRLIATPGADTPLTHVWDWRGSCYYRSSEFVGDASVNLEFATTAVTDEIQALETAAFRVGTGLDVNGVGRVFNYMALSAEALWAAGLFQSFTGFGTGATPSATVALGFTPAIAFARRYTALAAGGVWRGADQAGLVSTYSSGAGSVATGGIRTFGTTLEIGDVVAPNGAPFYGWAFKGSGSVTQPIGIGDRVGPYGVGGSRNSRGYASGSSGVRGTLKSGVPDPLYPARWGAAVTSAGWSLQRCDIKVRREES